jgi:uncharacterized protein (DUF1800 family)
MNRKAFFKAMVSPVSAETDPISQRYENKVVPTFSRLRTGLEKYEGPMTEAHILHLFKRCLFGVSQSDLAWAEGKSLDFILDQLLSDEPLPAPPLNFYQETVEDPFCGLGESWVAAPLNDVNPVRNQREISLRSWLAALQVRQGISLREQMVYFWHNHFPVESPDIQDPRILYRYNDLLRRFALGNFRELVYQITLDPAMLIYLNGRRNTRTAPDENYARELMELFTLGKGPESQYTETDVREAAKVLTGWRLRLPQIEVFFQANQHDSGNKTFSAFFGNRTITGKTGDQGAEETQELIDMLFEKEEMALFICRKLYRHFIYYAIDAQAESEVIQPLASLFIQSGFELKPVLRALLSSAHFHDELNRGCYIKTPLNTCAGMARSLQIAFPEAAQNLRAHYLLYYDIFLKSAEQQLTFFGPPNVAGWPAYYQEPQYYQLWINATTLPLRDTFATQMIARGLVRLGARAQINTVAFCESLPVTPDPNLLLERLGRLLLGLDISEARMNYLKSILLSGQEEDYYWTDAWLNYVNFPTTANRNIVKSRLDAVFSYLLAIPEYHLC